MAVISHINHKFRYQINHIDYTYLYYINPIKYKYVNTHFFAANDYSAHLLCITRVIRPHNDRVKLIVKRNLLPTYLQTFCLIFNISGVVIISGNELRSSEQFALMKATWLFTCDLQKIARGFVGNSLRMCTSQRDTFTLFLLCLLIKNTP